MVLDTDQVAIKRAINEVQARTRKWWTRHSDCVKSIAIIGSEECSVSDNELCCGVVRDMCDKTPCAGFLICSGKSVRNRTWRILEENPIQIDTENGTDWLIQYADWELPEAYTPLIQTAIIATSGMSDVDLARLIKVKPSDIEKWYTGEACMPDKVIKDITTRFIYGK